jgi:HSP20 family protein
MVRIPIKQHRPSLAASTPRAWHPIEGLRQEVTRLIDDFGQGYWQPLRRSLFASGPLVRRALTWETGIAPPVDVMESEIAYEIMAEMPGMDERNIEVKVADGTLIIKGEKQGKREEKGREYYLRERNFGSFERSFTVPETVDTDKIEASFKSGVLTLILPKKPEAQKRAKKVEVKAA